METRWRKKVSYSLPHIIHIEYPLMLVSKILKNRNISMKLNLRCPLHNKLLGNNLKYQFAMLTVPVLQNDYNSMF